MRDFRGEWMKALSRTRLSAIVVSGVLVAAIFSIALLSCSFGIERGQDRRLVWTGYAQVLDSVCAIISRQKYHTGRYVCAGNASQQLQDLGLGYRDEILARSGHTLAQWLADTNFLNDAIEKAFALPQQTASGEISAIGWGQDAGYMDAVALAFRLFGHRVEALYYFFFQLLFFTTLIFCIQFWRNQFALFATLSFHFAIYAYLPHLTNINVYSASNPRFLSLLAFIPLIHAIFLIVWRVRPSIRTVVLFIPQAVVLVAAADFRGLAYGVAIALTVSGIVLFCFDRLRNKPPLKTALRPYWPVYLILICIAASFTGQAITTDSRLAQIGGMKAHTLWEPLYYDLQLHPDWNRKYAAQHDGASGDATAEVAVKHYRQRHNLLHNKSDFLYGDESRGLTLVAYEKYVRDAYLEFVFNDPWYVVQLKFYDARNLFAFVTGSMRYIWGALRWPVVLVAILTALAVFARSRSDRQNFSNFTVCTAVLVLNAFLIACPVWATVVNADLLTDITLFVGSVTFIVTIWALVAAGVFLNELLRSWRKQAPQIGHTSA